MSNPALDQFQQAVQLTTQNLVSEAATAFRTVVDRWPDDDLADDALYNVGACYLAMNQFGHAAETFREVIQRYPKATISSANGRSETGRTAAKALLGLVAANLGLGDAAAAKQACSELEPYVDSKVVMPGGLERSFHDIGVALLAAAMPEKDAEALEVGPGDVAEA